ncbi:putative two-component sensor kinase [Pseudonocardia sp. Ae168_Ps1]|nr:putative two-component sensor kinase [Pseudonocardia sp. Ae150A_Ps1]OLL80719.1 putative two-component sensor kinase [Pseudonocardia sp. Ae168_Ps1]OLL85154.1 putative two-component sensor kinase [Pseudonocardia sp. Ae263_Ps1]OLL94821.1 putative two-component sensor kinase [Pseudonocardia sp. Ae356_Ps1]
MRIVSGSAQVVGDTLVGVMSTLRRLRERTGVRAASALAAAAAVALVLVVAGVSLVLVLDQTLKANTRDALQQTAQQLATRVEANFSGSSDPKRNAIDATGKRTDIVQIATAYSDETNAPDWMVGSNGAQKDVQIIGSSDPLDEADPIVPWLLAPGETRSEADVPITYRNGADQVGDDETATENMMVVGLGARAQGRPITVYAAQDLKPVHQAVETVGLLAAGGIPVLVLVAGFFTYLFAGRALRPVEEMRSRVAGMGEKDLSERVPEPASRDEVGRLARTMNQMLGRIESSQATQRRFVADASHELRSPLATVSTGLELLGTGMAEESADRATVETLRGETARLTGLVEGLLFLARADERGLAPRREEVDLDEIADAERVRPSGATAVAVRVTTEPARVVGDRGQLVRVVRNLVDNAKRHATSTVTVSVGTDGATAVIDVEDDGCGVPEADRARVFERFVRLDEARSRGDGGSGLGLSIVSELVAAHGGTVAALESPELGGARFRVTLPAVVAAPVPEPDDESEPSGASEPDPDLRDDRPSGPLPRILEIPAGAHSGPAKPGPAPSGPAPSGGASGAVDLAGAAGAAGAEANRTATPAGGNGVTPEVTSAGGGATRPSPGAPRPEQDAGRAQRRNDPPTGPLPIRPDTVGSPADENETRPLPVVRAGTGPRGGTAVATRNGGTRTGAARAETAQGEAARSGESRAPAPRRPDDRRS